MVLLIEQQRSILHLAHNEEADFLTSRKLSWRLRDRVVAGSSMMIAFIDGIEIVRYELTFRDEQEEIEFFKNGDLSNLRRRDSLHFELAPYSQKPWQETCVYLPSTNLVGWICR